MGIYTLPTGMSGRLRHWYWTNRCVSKNPNPGVITSVSRQSDGPMTSHPPAEGGWDSIGISSPSAQAGSWHLRGKEPNTTPRRTSI